MVRMYIIDKYHLTKPTNHYTSILHRVKYTLTEYVDIQVYAAVAQLIERAHGKGKVTSLILVGGSIFPNVANTSDNYKFNFIQTLIINLYSIIYLINDKQK